MEGGREVMEDSYFFLFSQLRQKETATCKVVSNGEPR